MNTALPTLGASVWDGVVGQTEAVSRLQRSAESPVHAYLFIGPAGSGKRLAARAFASLLIAGTDDPHNRDADLIMREEHPDVAEIVRAGASISADQAREIVRTAALAPVEGARKVMILHEFHLLRPEGAAILLKTIEEPPASTVIIVLADFIPHDLITISSRCARIDFRSVGTAEIIAMLVSAGVDAARAAEVAAAAGGNVDRAQVLATDVELAARRKAFARAPYRIDGTGNAAARITDELLGLIDAAGLAIAERHVTEVADLEERIERYGERGSGKKRLEERHKRELRRHRTDELLSGLAVIAGEYRDAMADGRAKDIDTAAVAVSRIYDAMQAFEFNPNESLLLQSLLWNLPVLSR